jgi:hypothetical protein
MKISYEGTVEQKFINYLEFVILMHGENDV